VRLFVAVELDSAVAQKIADFSDELRRKAMSVAPGARITWLHPEQLHVTVRFIGEVDAARAAAIAAALQPALTVKTVEIIVEGAGAFPLSGPPRVLWAGIAGGATELSALEQEVSERLGACGVAREDRPYRPHVTLARVRDASGLRSKPLFEKLAERRFGATPVEAITLFQSRTSPKGATYMALQRTPLRAG
jgi:RNA 2',3'-cyclic 3'-phosphodiesterase